MEVKGQNVREDGPMTGSVTALWRSVWESNPDHVVLTDASTQRVFTAADLNRATAQAAAALHDLGVRGGDAVVLSSAPGADTAINIVALLRLGAVVVPVNTAATSREIAHVAKVSGARLALADDRDRFDGIMPTVAPALTPSDSDELNLDEAAATDRALICFTSGTTGAPKGAPSSHANLVAGTRALVECWNWTADDVLVSALPMFHVHGLLVAWAGTLMAGASIVLHPRFDADIMVDSAREHHATLMFGVPTMWSRLAESGRLGELSSLRLTVSGSAPLAPSLCERIAADTGHPPVERYGMTETMILTSTPVDGERRAGTVGRPLPGMRVRIAADGVVEVSGDSVFDGYLIDSPDGPLVRAGFTDDGWFRTGDIGEWDGPDLRLVGRASELIITGGYNVYPREVEDVLRTDAAVADVAVVGVPDDTWGEVVTAFVVLSGEADHERWNSLCDEQLAPYKKPRAWHVVSDLPRNAMGKVRRDVLVSQAQQQLP